MLVHKTIPNTHEHGRSNNYGLDSTSNLTADPGEIYIDGLFALNFVDFLHKIMIPNLSVG